MSTIKAEVTTIHHIRPHPNADALEIGSVGGWQVCIRKGTYRDGDPVVYLESGTVIGPDVAEQLGIRNYLAEKTDIDGNRVLVIHRVKLRGEPSFGLVVTPEPGMQVGDDVAAHYGVRKYEPPVRLTTTDALPDDPRFPQYTNIENLRSYPDVLTEGEPVVVSEKVHGTNVRLAIIRGEDDAGQPNWFAMAGSRTLRRKAPSAEALRQNIYWFPWSLYPVKRLLEALATDRAQRQAILYGEVFGPGIQAYTYGQNRPGFRAFDLMVDGQYLAHGVFQALCDEHDVPTVPLVGIVPYRLETVKTLSEGPSLIGGTHGREGVVVKPLVERTHPAVGRVVLKYVSDTYLFGKAAEQDTTDI